MSKHKYFISRNYKAHASAAGKAKIDCEIAFKQVGLINLGLPKSTVTFSAVGFFLTLLSLIVGLIRLPRNSILVVQYPTKKYYNLIVSLAKLKKCQVVTVIHDLRSHRKQKMSVANEIDILNRNDAIVSHNANMSEWLKKHGLKSRTINLNIFDYYSDDLPKHKNIDSYQQSYTLIFAGVLEKRKNGFIYQLDQLSPQHYLFNLYGVGFEQGELREGSVIDYKGVFPASELVNCIEGEFGLVWDGTALDECKGNFGEYLKINNPHKTSMYLRAGIPVIVWDKAAIADFILEHNVGLVVSSLAEIDSLLSQLTREQYLSMLDNTAKLSVKLGQGYFIKEALAQAI